MFEDDLRHIRDRWQAAFGQYDELKAAAEHVVVRWEWTEGDRYTLLPFYFNRVSGRARRLKERPTSDGYYIHYGFDDRGRVRLHRFVRLSGHGDPQPPRSGHHQGDLAADVIGETFYDYGDTLTETIEFSIFPRIPLKVHQVFRQDERVVRHVSMELNGYAPPYIEKGKTPDDLYERLGPGGRFLAVENYVHEGNRLTTIIGYREVPGPPPHHFEERFTYDEDGRLQRIDGIHEDGRKWIVYQRRKKGQTFQSIREAATQKLIKAVIERLRAAHIDERLYCIELGYQALNYHFPPWIVPGLERYRQDLVSSSNPDVRFFIFSPALQGKERSLEITDPDTLEICQLLEQEIQVGKKWDTATRILRDVAAALTHHDWTGILDITPDFVVYAIDHEMEGHDLEGVLSTSASHEQIQEWKGKGWL